MSPISKQPVAMTTDLLGIVPAPLLAQTPAKSKSNNPTTSTIASPVADSTAGMVPQIWQYSTIALAIALSVLGITSALQHKRLTKKLRLETLKNKEMHRRTETATATITKMEKNPDLIHSRDFNLDYLRMRMAEEAFRFNVVNQIKIKIKQQITLALRPTQALEGELGISSTGRTIDQILDVEYEPSDMPKGTKRVLFRVEIKMVKLPTQPTSVTISQITDCIESFLSPSQENDSWQPTIQGRLANMYWDQKAKPTPRLLLEQTQEGSNVTFRTTRMTNKS
jgi:hypothetical protein